MAANPWTLADPTVRHLHFEPEAEVLAISRWLAHQRAVHREQMDETAYRLVSAANATTPVTDGERAAIVAQPRGAVWVIGRLGGDPHLYVLNDAESAAKRTLELGIDLGVEAIVIDLGGDILLRQTPLPPPTLRVARHDDHWGVFVDDRLVATAPTRDRARAKAKLLKANPDFVNDPRVLLDS